MLVSAHSANAQPLQTSQRQQAQLLMQNQSLHGSDRLGSVLQNPTLPGSSGIQGQVGKRPERLKRPSALACIMKYQSHATPQTSFTYQEATGGLHMQDDPTHPNAQRTADIYTDCSRLQQDNNKKGRLNIGTSASQQGTMFVLSKSRRVTTPQLGRNNSQHISTLSPVLNTPGVATLPSALAGRLNSTTSTMANSLLGTSNAGTDPTLGELSKISSTKTRTTVAPATAARERALKRLVQSSELYDPLKGGVLPSKVMQQYQTYQELPSR